VHVDTWASAQPRHIFAEADLVERFVCPHAVIAMRPDVAHAKSLNRQVHNYRAVPNGTSQPLPDSVKPHPRRWLAAMKQPSIGRQESSTDPVPRKVALHPFMPGPTHFIETLW
jgi:hypothetical protein